MTLWNAIARPILEYGAEVCLRVTEEARENVESVQTSFGKGILGLQSGAASDFVRSELGQERIESCWRKRIDVSRVLHRLAIQRLGTVAARIQGLSTLEAYARIKHWGVVTDWDACYSGEVGRPGARVLSRYLDDRFMRKGTRLKMLCRADLLSVKTPLIGCATSATLLQSSRSITSCSIVVGTTAPELCFCGLLLVIIQVVAVW
jgi:hypothetical protein